MVNKAKSEFGFCSSCNRYMKQTDNGLCDRCKEKLTKFVVSKKKSIEYASKLH